MARLPVPRSDESAWGNILNDFLLVSHHRDGGLRGVINVVNIKDYGATGDGEIDDTAAIQQALDALSERGVVVAPIPLESYKISQSLVITKSLNFIGIGVLPTSTSTYFDPPVNNFS